MKNFSLATIVISILYIVFATAAGVVHAAGTSTCQPVYGGGQTCVQVGNISIDKKIMHPKNNSLVDGLGLNDDKFAPESPVTFQINVTNTGNAKINKIFVKDIFPQYVDFSAGAGSFDGNSKTLSFEIIDLNPGEKRTQNIVGKVVSANALPGDKSVVCVVNQATAQNADDNTQVSRDTVQLCIEKNLPAQPGQPGTVTTFPVETKGGLKIFPPKIITTTPSTGPEALALLALLPTGAFGFFLRKKAQ